MRYRNTITGLIFEATSEIHSKHIEALDETRSITLAKPEEKAEEKPKPKRKKRVKK